MLDEIKGKFSQELPNLLAKYKKEYKNLNGLIDIHEIGIDINEEIEKYENWLIQNNNKSPLYP